MGGDTGERTPADPAPIARHCAGPSARGTGDEISATALVAAYYGKHSARLLAPKRAAGVIPLLTKTGELHHPKGVVGVITPWNYPLALTAMDVLPALAAGNTVVQKPDNQTALTRLRAGTVNINEGYAATFGSVGVPMGGMKESGVGRRNGADGLLRYTETQSIAAQRGFRLRPPRLVPPRAWTRTLTASLKLLRRLPWR